MAYLPGAGFPFRRLVFQSDFSLLRSFGLPSHNGPQSTGVSLLASKRLSPFRWTKPCLTATVLILPLIGNKRLFLARKGSPLGSCTKSPFFFSRPTRAKLLAWCFSPSRKASSAVEKIRKSFCLTGRASPSPKRPCRPVRVLTRDVMGFAPLCRRITSPPRVTLLFDPEPAFLRFFFFSHLPSRLFRFPPFSA